MCSAQKPIYQTFVSLNIGPATYIHLVHGLRVQENSHAAVGSLGQQHEGEMLRIVGVDSELN